MADWTVNSGFGATRDRGTVRRAEPVLRPARDAAQAPRADRLAASRDWDEPAAEAEPKPRVAPGAAALAQYNATLEGPLAKARLAVWAGGGALSLLLIAGVGIWGYKLVLREVMGLPVIVADAGPMRVLPANPGGALVPQQGFAVNAIPGDGTAAPPSDVLMLAPQTRGLAEEDMQVVQTDAEQGEVMPAADAAPTEPAAATEVATVNQASPAVPTESAAAAPAPESPLGTLAAAATAALDPDAAPADKATQAARLVASLVPAEQTLTAADIQALADQFAAGAQLLTPLASTGPAEATLATAAAAPTVPAAAAAIPTTPEPAVTATPAAPAVQIIAATVPGPSVALVPRVRPAMLSAAAAPAATAPAAAVTVASAEAAPAAEAPAPVPAPAASVASGTHLVQLGAFDSPEIATSEWARLQATHPQFLGGREHVVQEVQSGGRTLYRLRTLGFPERADARILCAALSAEGTDCIPVTVD